MMIERFRTMTGDISYAKPAVVIEIDPTAGLRDAEVTVTVLNGVLALTPSTGRGGLQISLQDERVSTLEKLVEYLNAQRSYNAHLGRNAKSYHDSIDIGDVYNREISPELDGVTLYSHVYCDRECWAFLERGMNRHNPTFSSLDEVPPNELDFVFTLARCEFLGDLAADATRRAYMEESVSTLLDLKADLENQYKRDYSRLNRAFKPIENTPEVQGEGDVLVGQYNRKDPRWGFMYPLNRNKAPYKPLLNEVIPSDISDKSVLIRWIRPAEVDWARIELWRDTRPEVRREDVSKTAYMTTSRRVFAYPWAKSESASVTILPNFNYDSNAEFVPTKFLDETVEPDTRYYYKLYVVDSTGMMSSSDTILVETAPLRALLDDTAPVTPTFTTLGTLEPLTFAGTGFVAGCRFYVGEKEITNVVIVTPNQATGDLPPFYNENQTGSKIVTVVSPEGQLDQVPAGFELRA